jgi:hypothetical protein
MLLALLLTAAKMAASTTLYSESPIASWQKKGRTSPLKSDYIEHRAPHFQALLVASAMVARGAIGFLLASVS